jgi:hypothetical protein
MDNQLVRYSRAGDAFHYRWAARRCLRLIDPHSLLKCITIESSKEFKAAGEYVIDLAEYSEIEGGRQSVEYCQLKHTTTRTRKAFARSEMSDTLKAFAKRYSALLLKPKRKRPDGPVTFSFVTNRPINKALKQGVLAIASGAKADRRSQKYLEQTTRLRDAHLRAFCASLSLVDGEGDYIVQKHRLKNGVSEYISGFVNSQQIESIIAMVADRALPKSEDGRSNGEIYREDVLQRFGVTSERDLFPAPAELEKLSRPIKREQHDQILKHIIEATGPSIIHAAGGVGKSVVARQLAQSLPKGSQGFIYDCFGGGKYRNPSEPRHRACDALIQLANEMAARGLCRPLIGHAGVASDAIFRSFLERVKQASESLRQIASDALLVLLIDAADNAELAAAENSDRCFAHELLRETLPPRCRLVMFCRTERIELLKPRSTTPTYELLSFSKHETAAHLRQHYAEAPDRDCLEFHRLTGGNPRVQANALDQGNDLADDLSRLGPGQSTVASQIATQLDAAISAVRDRHVDQSQIDSICRGLANLPPFVPIEVLATAAGVDTAAVRSFISDLGRPLWHTDDAVQFRDEPTETWFREKFAATKTQIETYLIALEPLAKNYTYVAKVLPQLLLRSEKYDRLVSLALSDDLLPENNAIDERDIRLYRLQFAFKAALRLGRYADAARLAFRAGEEAAGNNRQLSLLQGDTHLIAPLLGPHRIQELAYRQVLRGAWKGSQNVFSASLLSSVKDFHGEAGTYLRAAHRWLTIYFDERNKRAKAEKERSFHPEELHDSDIAELSWARLNLSGPEDTVKFLTSWSPPEFVFRVTRLLIRRLIDAARFGEIDQIAALGARNIYLMLAVADELAAVARFPEKRVLRHSLDLLAAKRTRLPKPEPHLAEDLITPAILSLLEASAARRLSRKKIQSALRLHASAVASRSVGSRSREESRREFLRGVALKATIEGKQYVPPESLLPPKMSKKSEPIGRDLSDSDKRDITECIGALLPWYILRAQLLATDSSVGEKEMKNAKELSEKALAGRYSTFEPLPWEISRVRFDLLALNPTPSRSHITAFIDSLKTAKQFALDDRLNAARTAFRLTHLNNLREPLELSCRETIEGPGTEGPEERAGWFVSLAKAVLPRSAADAAAYFNQAVEAVSKFGDEMVERWEAVVAVARRASLQAPSTPETAYRFVRCAEIIGDTVAREKYWNRDDVFRVAVHLHPPSAFAALSRWRDRAVGSFDRQLKALAKEAVSAGILSPAIAWCLSGFADCNGSAKYAALCIERETVRAMQQRILDSAVRDLELVGTSLQDLKTLEDAANAAKLSKVKLTQLVEIYPSDDLQSTKAIAAPVVLTTNDQNRKPRCLDDFFVGIDVHTSEGIETAAERFRAAEPPREFELFWKQAIHRVAAGRENDFLRSLISAGQLDSYDIRAAVTEVRAEWLRKAAMKREWPSFVKAVGKRLAIDLSKLWSLSHFTDRSQLDSTEVAALKAGLVEGLAESPELMDANTFFGFVYQIADRLTTDEAYDLLDYALSRFEKHIDDDHGDGLWSQWLTPPADVSDAVVGLIWSALGSPYSATRWEAAHSVRRLADNSCELEIASLIDQMRTGSAGAFGSSKFPFYDLHAKLYLLIGLARAAVDDPTVLQSQANIVAQLALEGLPHILIQRTAAQIALAIEANSPGSYEADVVAKVAKVGSSPLPATITNDYRYRVTSPWHSAGKVDLGTNLHLGYDFDHYWLGPLGEVFGISEEAMVQLACDTAVHNLKISRADKYVKDPRQRQWDALNRFDGPLNTWHDHGSYPRVDDYRFYYSYHACFTLAGKLLAALPVVRRPESDEDRWHYWLGHHLMTRSDGKWLSDRRDASPIHRRAWVRNSSREHWQWGICAEDFLEMLRQQSSLRRSVCVSGHWMECDGPYEEEVFVASALVDPASAEAVATALRASNDTYGCALPRFGDDKPPPDLTAWIRQFEGQRRGLDSFDPYARDIRYLPSEIGDTFAELLNLSPDSERREWRLPGASDPSLICEVWSDERPDVRDRSHRFGERMQASVDLLRALCERIHKSLLFEVRIRRRVERQYSPDDEIGYVPPSRKIFVLSSDGMLRDKQQRYNLDR